jgi:hypothetical protein
MWHLASRFATVRQKSTGNSDGTVTDTVYGDRNAVNTVDGAEP